MSAKQLAGASAPDGSTYITLTDGAGTLIGTGGASGTVTAVSVTTAHGVSGVVADNTTTPAITLTLGAITPSTVTIGAGSAITSSGAGGALGTNAYTSTAYAPVASPTFTGTATTAALTVGSGSVLKIGNAATTGLTAGVLAALTNATIVITDSTGQAYRIPCII